MMQGYVSCAYGSVCSALVTAISVLWVVLFILIDFGYYHNCEFTGIDNACFFGDYILFGSYETNSHAMFTGPPNKTPHHSPIPTLCVAVWCLSILWYVLVMRHYDTIWNYFLLPASLPTAEFVAVTVLTYAPHSTVLSNRGDTGRPLKRLRCLWRTPPGFSGGG